MSQLPKINRTCAACIINTLIWCPSCSQSRARLHSALCRARQEALNLATINRPRAQASFDFILLWLTGINTLSFARASTSTSPYRHVCCACGGSPTGKSAGDSAWRDAGLLWYCWRCLQDAALIGDVVCVWDSLIKRFYSVFMCMCVATLIWFQCWSLSYSHCEHWL